MDEKEEVEETKESESNSTPPASKEEVTPKNKLPEPRDAKDSQRVELNLGDSEGVVQLTDQQDEEED